MEHLGPWLQWSMGHRNNVETNLRTMLRATCGQTLCLKDSFCKNLFQTCFFYHPKLGPCTQLPKVKPGETSFTFGARAGCPKASDVAPDRRIHGFSKVGHASRGILKAVWDPQYSTMPNLQVFGASIKLQNNHSISKCTDFMIIRFGC